jgi:hypothetical protein
MKKIGYESVTDDRKSSMDAIVILGKEYLRLGALRREHEKKTDDAVNAYIRERGIIGEDGTPAKDFYDISDSQLDALHEELDAATFAAGLTDRDGNTLPEYRTLDRERDISGRIKSLLARLSDTPEEKMRSLYPSDIEKLVKLYGDCIKTA